MNDIEKQFVASLQANPDDNACRRVYADWLEEQGRTDDAMYILFAQKIKASIEFRFAVNGIKEVKCPKCNLIPVLLADRIAASVVSSYCYTDLWFYYYFQQGNTYKFRNGIWQYWSGIDDKWWVKVKEGEIINELEKAFGNTRSKK